jgi:hypothetical protein
METYRAGIRPYTHYHPAQPMSNPHPINNMKVPAPAPALTRPTPPKAAKRVSQIPEPASDRSLARSELTTRVEKPKPPEGLQAVSPHLSLILYKMVAGKGHYGLGPHPRTR